MSDDAPILTAYTIDGQGFYCLADPSVLIGVIARADNIAARLDEASRAGQLVLIQNIDQAEGLEGLATFRLLINDPLPSHLVQFSREELRDCTLEVPSGRVLFAPVAVLQSQQIDLESPSVDQFFRGIGDSGTAVEIPPGFYQVEVHSLHYGEDRRDELIKGRLSEADFDAWKRWESWRNAGCGLGCLGIFAGIVAAAIFKSLGNQQMAIWVGAGAALTLMIGMSHFWIVGRSARYQQLKQLFTAAGGEYPHGVVRLTPALEGTGEHHTAKCGWAFGN